MYCREINIPTYKHLVYIYLYIVGKLYCSCDMNWKIMIIIIIEYRGVEYIYDFENVNT